METWVLFLRFLAGITLSLCHSDVGLLPATAPPSSQAGRSVQCVGFTPFPKKVGGAEIPSSHRDERKLMVASPENTKIKCLNSAWEEISFSGYWCGAGNPSSVGITGFTC